MMRGLRERDGWCVWIRWWAPESTWPKNAQTVHLQAGRSMGRPLRNTVQIFKPTDYQSARGATIVTMMDRVPPQPVKDPPSLIRSGSFSLDRLLSHTDPGSAEESEDFVNRIYEQRRIDLSSDRNGKTGS